MSLFSLGRADGRQEGLSESLHRHRARSASRRRSRGWASKSARTSYFDYYYGLIDFEFFARKNIGEDAVTWMKANVHPLDIVFRLAEDHGIVLLNGSGFAAPDWSVRISFANLDDHVYDDIGRALRAIARGYRQAVRGGHRQERQAGRTAETRQRRRSRRERRRAHGRGRSPMASAARVASTRYVTLRWPSRSRCMTTC